MLQAHTGALEDVQGAFKGGLRGVETLLFVLDQAEQGVGAPLQPEQLAGCGLIQRACGQFIGQLCFIQQKGDAGQ